MSREKYDASCPGCRPAILGIDPFTGQLGKVVPESDPKMQAALSVWEQLTEREREAWHDFTCLNSREPSVMAHATDIAHRMRLAIESALERQN